MLVFVYVAVAVFVSMSVLKIVAILLCMAVIFVVSPVLMSDSALDEQSFNANENDNRWDKDKWNKSEVYLFCCEGIWQNVDHGVAYHCPATQCV